MASLGIVCRWHVANLEPTYLVGEGVYSETVAPEPDNKREPDAATFYKVAADALEVEYPASLKNGPSSLIDATVSQQRPVVEQAQPAFALLRQGMNYSYDGERGARYFIAEAEDAATPTAHNFAFYRDVSRLLAVEARVKAADGDGFGALQSSLDVIRLGGDCGQGRSLLEGLLGVLCQMIGSREAIRHIDGLSAPQARAGVWRLQKILKTERTFAEIMTDERDTVSYDTLKAIFRDGTLHGANPNTAEPIDLRSSPWRFAIATTLFTYTKQGLVNDFARYYDQVLNRAKMPYQLAARLYPVPASSNPMVNYWIESDYSRAHHHTVQQSAYNHVLLAQLAIQAYRCEHKGAAPVSLKELTTGSNRYIDSLPIDPFSQTGKLTLRYDPRKGRAYSVGENGRDDGNCKDDNSNLYDR